MIQELVVIETVETVAFSSCQAKMPLLDTFDERLTPYFVNVIAYDVVAFKIKMLQE